MTRKRC